MIKYYFILCLLISMNLLTAMPVWYSEADNTLEYQDYLIGKGIYEYNRKTKANALEKAKAEALKNLAMMLSSQVTGEILVKQSEKIHNNEVKAEECFVNETQIRSNLEFVNAQVLKNERDDGMIYVLVGIPKADLKNYYKNKVLDHLDFITQAYLTTNKDVALVSREDIQLLKQALIRYEQAKEFYKTWQVINQWQSDLDYYWQKAPKQAELNYRLSVYESGRAKSVYDIAEELCENMNLNPQYPVLLQPVNFENFQFVSDFSKQLNSSIHSILQNKYNMRVIESIENDSVYYQTKGKIMESGKEFNVLFSIKDAVSYKEISNQSLINQLSVSKLGREFIQPKNYKQLLEDRIQLCNAIQTDNSLKVDLQTDKLTDGAVTYVFGDEPKIFIRANKACYVRLIYIFADGTKTLLIDNYFVGKHQINQWIKIGNEFEVCGPEGSEQLLLQASTSELPPISISRKMIDGNDFIDYIQNNDFSLHLGKTRGIKQKSSKQEITESTYQWTIFEK